MLSTLPILSLASVAILCTLVPTTFASSSSPDLVNHGKYEAWLVSKMRGDSESIDIAFAKREEEDPYLPPGYRRTRNHAHGFVHKQASPVVTSTADAEPAATAEIGKRATSAASSSSTYQAPSVVATTLLGFATNDPSLNYFSGLKSQALPSVPSTLLTVALDVIAPLATEYPMYNGSGAVTLTPANQAQLEPLQTVPWISRDAGRGGNLNGVRMFIFSDSETFTAPPNESATGQFTGFVSNSVATDMGFEAANGNAPILRDRVGQWTNNNGGLRGWIPWTTGEKEYNNYMSNHGGRIAIWPSSAITMLNETTAIQYASMVLVNTTNGANFHFVGVTMYEITVPNTRSGPVATRTAPFLFPYTGMEWGSTGGTRSWGKEGPGGNDGWVWAWANNGAGLWAARAPAASVSSLDAYEYYWASTGKWNSTAPPPGSGSADVTIGGSYSASDIFYSARHGTFINVYADRYIDNKLLWRYLKVPAPIAPNYNGSDFNLYIIMYPWSNEQTLVQAPTPGNGDYIYGSGINQGYFGDDDIANGGNMMLVTWTSPTGQGSDTWVTQYQLGTATISWS